MSAREAQSVATVRNWGPSVPQDFHAANLYQRTANLEN